MFVARGLSMVARGAFSLVKGARRPLNRRCVNSRSGDARPPPRAKPSVVRGHARPSVAGTPRTRTAPVPTRGDRGRGGRRTGPPSSACGGLGRGPGKLAPTGVQRLALGVAGGTLDADDRVLGE